MSHVGLESRVLESRQQSDGEGSKEADSSVENPLVPVGSEQLGKGQRQKQRKYEQRRRKRLELKQREQEQGSEQPVQPQSVQPVPLPGEQSELL